MKTAYNEDIKTKGLTLVDMLVDK